MSETPITVTPDIYKATGYMFSHSLSQGTLSCYAHLEENLLMEQLNYKVVHTIKIVIHGSLSEIN